MRRFLALLLCFLVPSVALAADNTYKVAYDGGSVGGLKAGTSLQLSVEPKAIRLIKGKEPVLEVPAASFTEISYGQDVHRRVGAAIGVAVFTLGIGALLALTKSKKHFIGVTWGGW